MDCRGLTRDSEELCVDRGGSALEVMTRSESLLPDASSLSSSRSPPVSRLLSRFVAARVRMLERRPVRRTEARRARGARLGALLLVLARRSALLGLLRLPSGLVPPDGGTLRSRRWRQFLRFWIHTSHTFGFGSTQVTLLVLDPHKLNFGFGSTQVKFGSTQANFLVWIHTRQLFGFGSTQANFLVWIHARQLFWFGSTQACFGSTQIIVPLITRSPPSALFWIRRLGCGESTSAYCKQNGIMS